MFATGLGGIRDHSAGAEAELRDWVWAPIYLVSSICRLATAKRVAGARIRAGISEDIGIRSRSARGVHRNNVTQLLPMIDSSRRSTRSHRCGANTGGSSNAPSAQLDWFRRRRVVLWEIHDDIHEAFPSLVSAIICFRGPTT